MAHSIRLLKMGIEILTQGTLTVNRKKAGDADYLLSIRNGNIAYEEVKQIAETLFEEIKTVKTDLPPQVDSEFLTQVCVELVGMAMKKW
jgi:hypothetical protein